MSLKEKFENHPVIFLLGLVIAGFGAGFTACEKLKPFLGDSEIPVLQQVSFIHSSSLPMYFSDTGSVVLDCNDAFLAAVDMERTAVIGKPVWNIVEHMSQYVPEKQRDSFLQEQRELQQRSFNQKLPHADATFLIDMRQSRNERLRRVFEVWVHVDKVVPKGKTDAVGILAILRQSEVSEQVLSERSRKKVQRRSTSQGK